VGASARAAPTVMKYHFMIPLLTDFIVATYTF